MTRRQRKRQVREDQVHENNDKNAEPGHVVVPPTYLAWLGSGGPYPRPCTVPRWLPLAEAPPLAILGLGLELLHPHRVDVPDPQVQVLRHCPLNRPPLPVRPSAAASASKSRCLVISFRLQVLLSCSSFNSLPVLVLGMK